MQNSPFMKILGFGLTLMALTFGYLLLPDNNDWRKDVEKKKTTAFLKGFTRVEKPEKKAFLPASTLLSREGRPVDLSEITKGRVTVVNFWATWCAPCIEELPSLAKFQEVNGEILVLPVSLDLNKKLPELARFFEKPSLRDLRWFYDNTGQLRRSLNLPAFPATYILDKEGRIIYILQGPNDWSSPEASDFADYLKNFMSK